MLSSLDSLYRCNHSRHQHLTGHIMSNRILLSSLTLLSAVNEHFVNVAHETFSPNMFLIVGFALDVMNSH